jgi:hypothetical protein
LPRMDRTRLLYSAVLAGAACLALEVATGLILWFAVPSGHGPRFRGRGAEHSFIGVDRSTWIDLHDWVGLLLAAVIVVHVALNWGWVMKQTRLVLAESTGRPIVPPPEEGDQ